MVSCDGVTAALLFSKQRFTSSDRHRSSPSREDEQIDGGEEADQQEIDDLNVSSFTPMEAPTGFENLESKVSRVHVLGGGNIWKFVAHAIAGIPNPPHITLLFRSHTMHRRWQASDRFIEVITDGKGEKRYGFEVELIGSLKKENLSVTPINAYREDSVMPPEDSPDTNHGADNAANSDIIHHLIISVSARTTVSELSNVAHRLTQDSTIVFMHKGLGILDEVNEQVFPDEMTRPSYLVGLVSHRVYTSPGNPFSVIHGRMGTMALGTPLRSSALQIRTDKEGLTNMIRSNLYLTRTLTRTLDLAAVCFYPIDFFQLQIEKLAFQAVIHPLTVLLDCPNGGLNKNHPASRVIKLLLAEISLVIRSLPELQGIPNVNMRFSPNRLVSLTHGIADATTGHISSMLKEVRNGTFTDINYINGYIVRRGEEMGIKCVLNYMVMQMIQAKLVIKRRLDEESLPLQ